MRPSSILLTACTFLIGQSAFGMDIETITERRLVVLTDHDESANYHIVGFTDAAANYREVFGKLWKHHSDIRFATRAEMPEILKESGSGNLAVVMLNTMLDKRPGMEQWENFPVLGVYPGEQFEDPSKIGNLMVPITCYVFPEYRPLITEFILAVKFMNDKVACKVKKTGCDMDDDIERNQGSIKQRTLVVLNWYAGTPTEQDAASGCFGGGVEFVDNVGFWAIYNGPKAAEYSFLAIASNKYGKITTTYFIANMSDAAIMAKQVPGGMDYIAGHRRAEDKYLRKLGKVYTE